MNNVTLKIGAYGSNVASLQTALSNQGFLPPASEMSQAFFGPGTRQAVMAFQASKKLPQTGETDAQTASLLAAGAKPATASAVVNSIIGAAPAAATNTLSGTLVLDNGLPAAGITIHLYSIGFGGQDTLLGVTQSGANGAYSIHYTPKGTANLQVRVLEPTGKEVTLSTTQYNASTTAALNLVVPSSVSPSAAEFQMLSTSMAKSIDGVARLTVAQENAGQQDLTLLNQTTNWDARVTALAALAAQHSPTTGISQEGLYTMFRAGLPSDPAALANIPPATVQQALNTASKAGITSMTADQIQTTVTAFTNFAKQSQLATIPSGGVSTFAQMASTHIKDAAQQGVFTNLYTSSGTSDSFWTTAAQLGIPVETLDSLKLQGKFLYLTFNNALLASALQSQLGQVASLSQLAEKDFDTSAAWQATLQTVANTNPGSTIDSLIPSAYTGATTADRLAAYTGDMARKVRFSFPTEVTARMLERQQLNVNATTAAPAATFLRAAAGLGYNLGRTPFNAFLASSGGQLPTLDAGTLETVRTLHRLFQITPSTESLQAALNAGFTSAAHIASIDQQDFIAKYGDLFPPYEAQWVWGRAQTISSVTFNICSSAVLMDTAPPVYSLSASAEQKQAAKNSLVEQFPSIASLFGNLDYCECRDCSSVLSPAAYFVDVLQFLGPPNPSTGASGSASNPAGYTPLDVLIGSLDNVIPGRRPDLGALPLTCENSDTAMPYIDLVNEILEYYIANSKLDTNLAYDTGAATTAELTAEPQNIIPKVYNTTLKNAFYPLGLPFDLWIATVRGFLGYFKTTLAQALDTLRPISNLELFTDANHYPYYRAQIFAERLGLSPSEYEVLTCNAAGLAPITSHWFQLYGYPNEAAALNGNATLEPLSSAETLAQVLGLSYQQLTDLLETGFLNPGLYPLIYQFQRLGIDMADAFNYTNQPGYPGLSGSALTAFEAQLNAITARYKALNPATSFDAIAWLKSVLPANYSSKVLVLADPDSGCNFGATTLQYADNKTAATRLDYLKFNLFVRLQQKLGWTTGQTDRALQAFFPQNLPAWTDPGFSAAFSAAWQTALVYIDHFNWLNKQLNPALGTDALLPLWSNLPVNGPDPLYGQLFLTSSVVNNDWAFDDPAGNFPVPLADLTAPSLQTFSSHLASIQGVLGLASDDVNAIFADPGVAADMVNVGGTNVPAFTLNNLSICYRYATLANCLGLDIEDMIDLKQMSGLNPFQPISGAAITHLSQDVLFNTTVPYVTWAQQVQGSGFAVEDLQYLLRHQFDPVGKYQVDLNAQLTLLQRTAAGLAQIQTQNALPPNLSSMPESLLDQILSGLIPSAILKSLFAILTNAQDFSATASAPAAIDPTPFASEPELSFSYDATKQVQTVTYPGLLLDWKKTELLAINTSAEFSGLLDGLQAAANTALAQSIGNILGVWASLVEYEAVETGATQGLPTAELLSTDPALSLSYDAVGQLQWAGYRGVLTDANKNALAAVAMPSAQLATLFSQIFAGLQSQSLPIYANLAGALLAMLANVQTFEAGTNPVTAATAATDASSFAAALQTAQQNGAITGQVPAIQFSYVDSTQTETISVQGVLTQSLVTQISGLTGVSANAQTLLASARASMVSLFQSLANGLLTVAATDLDKYVAPFLGLNAAQSQRQAKADLIQVFLPLEAEHLSLSFILQTLSSTLSSDPSLTEALISDTALLSDPSNPGKALEGSFLGLSQQGVSASYFGAGGALLASDIEATADTVNAPAAAAGFTSCAYTGYLQVPTDGPYRFFAELADVGAAANLQLTAPPNSPLIANPVIPITTGSGTATAANDEISQFVTLQGGVFYQFTLNFTSVGPNGARMLVQSENMPKGPLSQIVLCPQTAANNFITAYTLLAKSLQVIETTNVDVREISYMIANAPSFANLRLSSLPTQPSDVNMTALFQQMLMLIDYADLRKNPAGGTGGLIDVFEGAGVTFTEAPGSQATNTNPATPWAALAKLFRRDVSSVRTIATYFGYIQDQVVGPNEKVTAIGDFGNNAGIRRIWQALQLIQILGIPVPALTASTAIVSLNPPGNIIATNFKNAVKGQYTTQQWLPIAQSVFDPLRQAKRDALVSYIVQEKGFENENQLFEYFLIDPGMEPVVQTSRLRLGMSSLQTFVQRCLLNLESSNSNAALNISPSAIDADWWSWMKRYRVWQANREIFLYPENWMVPELRLGSSDLFQTLEGALLQGDVTDDLANQAFLDYLTGLEQRARLDVVATYLDQDLTDAGVSTLHVLARSYAHPHKYFYRTYSSSVWSGWTAVTQDFDGDHIAIAIWKGRLNVFWVTFIQQSQAPAPAANSDTTALGQMHFNALSGDISSSGNPTKLTQIQLHWSEYYQSKWSKPIASDVNKYNPIPVVDTFTPNAVHIRITKETVDNGNGEGAIRVVLDFPSGATLDTGYTFEIRKYSLAAGAAGRGGIIYRGPSPIPTYSFRVTSKNCDLVLNADFYNYPPWYPYNTGGVDASIFTGSGSLTSTFQSTINSDGSGSNSTEQILQSVDNYGLLLPSTPTSPSPFINSGPNLAQAGSLLSPFFYKDRPDTNNTDEMTFYVQPNLTVKTITDWTYWAVAEPVTSSVLTSGAYLDGLSLAPQTPTAGPAPSLPVDVSASLYGVQSSQDWLTSPATTVLYKNAIIGQTGGQNLNTVPAVVSIVSTPAGSAPQQQRIVFGPRGLANQARKPKSPAARK
jgi:peptidoglycan hydrolase-like protein with peptidoglycan-binding domain